MLILPPYMRGGPATSVFDAEADWESRSQASGVFYRNNFTYKNAAETQLITNTSDLISSAHTAFVTSKFEWDTTNKLTGGGSFRGNLLASAGANEAAPAYGLSFAGIGASGKGVIKHTFYFQFAVYAHHVWRDFDYQGGSLQGSKLAIIEAPDQSFDAGEVVVGRLNLGVFPFTYRLVGSADGFMLEWSSLSDFTFHSFIDRGTPTVSSVNTLQQRHGVNYQNAGNVNDADFQHSPKFVSDGWTVFEVYIDQVNDICKVWCAPYGEAPTLCMGAMNAGLPASGAVDGGGTQIYTGAQLLPRTENATAWPAEDTHVNFDEVIASDEEIEFPGGFALPYPGTEIPPGYPPSGSVEI